MSDTIYWAVKLDMPSVARLASHFPPIHSNVHAEHVTLVFNPSEEQEAKLIPECGKEVSMSVTGYAEDDKGQAVVVAGIDRLDGGLPHVTISCASGVRPVYSNRLLGRGISRSVEVPLKGTIARYTKGGWDTSCEELRDVETDGLGEGQT